MSDNIHLYAGAYALNALPLDERALYERHLAGCESCQLEVAEYTETAARLAAAVEFAPPSHLREQVLAAAARHRQLSPVSRTGLFAESARPYLMPVAAGLAALALGLGGVSAYLLDARNEALSELAVAETERELVQLLTDARQIVLDAPDGVTATFIHSPHEDRGMLVVHGLDELDREQTYQLWLIHDEVPVPAGTFSASTSPGPVVVPAEAQILGAELIAVTVEPAGGVDTPTGAILLSARL
jgi:anti-sigma-K factor RskA